MTREQQKRRAEERWIFWLHYWACFGISMAGWLVILCALFVFTDTSYTTSGSVIISFVAWAAMAAIWSMGPAEEAVRRFRANDD